jgi:hypothetical protein
VNFNKDFFLNYLLATGELKLSPPEGLNDGILMFVISPHGHQRLSDANTSHYTLRFAESSPHSGLQTISACAGQHLVDPQNVERMNPNPDVELILGCVLDHILKFRTKLH